MLTSLRFTRKSNVLGNEPAYSQTVVSGYALFLNQAYVRMSYQFSRIQMQIVVLLIMLAILLAYLSANRAKDTCKLRGIAYIYAKKKFQIG